MRRSSLRRGPFFFLFISAGLSFSADAWAVRWVDEMTGVNQAFTRGYEYRRFSEEASDTAEYELLVPEDRKEADRAAEKEEEQRNLDKWSYSRAAGYSVTYDSNQGGSLHDPKDDLIHHYSAELGMRRRSERTEVQLLYNGGYTSYVEKEKLSVTQHAQTTRVGYRFGRLRLDFSNSFSPRAAYDTAERTELENTTIGGDARRRVTALSDTFNSTATFKATQKVSLTSSYSRDYFFLPISENGPSANNFSSTTHTITNGVSYQWTRKTQLFMNGSYSFEDFFRGTDLSSRDYRLNFGASGRLTDKIYYAGSIGYLYRDYDSRGIRSRDAAVWALSLSRKLTEKISMTVAATKSVSANFDSADSNSITEDTYVYGVNFTYRLAPKMTVTLGGSANYTSSDTFVTQFDPDNPTLTFTRKPEDDIYEWYLSWGWTPRRWLTTLLAYQCTNHNSSFKAREFDDHKLVGSVHAAF